ncbi:hypothetical protein FB451DRAFT_1479095 [Mycena latifolia]|nr:hypothetical protein FB451DRAFT_1479095 [Mycena latifolia]
MTYTISVAHTLAVITVLPIGLIGLEHAASYLLNILRALATTHRFSLFFATSVVSVGAHHVYTFRVYGARMEAESEADYLFGDDLGTTIVKTTNIRQGPTRTRRALAQALHPHMASGQPIYCVVRLRAMAAPKLFSGNQTPAPIRPLSITARDSPSPLRCMFLQCIALQGIANASRHPLRHRRPILPSEITSRTPCNGAASTSPAIRCHSESLYPLLSALQLNPLPHKYAPKSTFISHFFFQDFLKMPVMTPYSYTPSHKRSWAVDAPSTAEDEHFPVDAIPTAPRAQPKSKSLVNAAASMPSARKPENRAREAATPLSAAHNRPAGSSAPSLPTRALHVSEPVSPSPIRVQQPAATSPPLSSATGKGAAPPTQRMQAPLPKGNPVPPTSAYIPSSPGAATPSDSEDVRIPWASEGKWSAGAPPSRLSATSTLPFL